MTVQVRYFASIREALGEGEPFDMPEPITVGELRNRLAMASDKHAEVLGRHRTLRVALDQVLCDESAVVDNDAEVAFFPPVTGG